MPAGGLQPGAQVSDDDSDSECAFFVLFFRVCVCVTHGTLVGTQKTTRPRCGALYARITSHSRQTHSM